MRKVPYSPPNCTICGNQATVFAKNKEPRCTRHHTAEAQTKECKTCGGLMMVRENKKNHSYFWGCSNFPRCSATAAI